MLVVVPIEFLGVDGFGCENAGAVEGRFVIVAVVFAVAVIEMTAVLGDANAAASAPGCLFGFTGSNPGWFAEAWSSTGGRVGIRVLEIGGDGHGLIIDWFLGK